MKESRKIRWDQLQPCPPYTSHSRSALFCQSTFPTCLPRRQLLYLSCLCVWSLCSLVGKPAKQRSGPSIQLSLHLSGPKGPLLPVQAVSPRSAGNLELLREGRVACVWAL